jgi:hypothetical protein
MINITSSLKINFVGQELQDAIRGSLSHASKCLLKSYELEHIDLRTVTTSTNFVVSYSKFVELGLAKTDTIFSDDFLLNAFACSQYPDTIPREMFEKFFPPLPIEGLEYKKYFARSVKKGIGLFLLSLHSKGAITLPITFNWPASRNSERSGSAGRMVCEHSELLTFVRSVETVPGRPQDAAFKVLRTPKRAEWFSTYATKLLLATGWRTPEQANYDDLFEIFSAQSSDDGERAAVSVFVTFAEVIKAKFNERVPSEFGRPGEWERRLNEHRSQKLFEKRAAELINFHDVASQNITHEEAFDNLKKINPSAAAPEKLQEALARLGSAHPLSHYVGYWVDLQVIYFKRRKRENYNGVSTALGHFNLYISYYLPAWFRQNPASTLKFPSSPDLLIGAVYISRLVRASEPLPKTFMEYMNERSVEAEWEGNSYYAMLKQLEIFFDFLVDNSHHFQDCSSFDQPLSHYDYPRTTSKSRTNKVPLPRRLFSAFLTYVETVKAYIDVTTEKILVGEIDLAISRELQRTNVVRCAAYSHVLDIPQIDIKGEIIRLDYIPSIFRFDWKTMCDGRVLLIPHPHAINQILTALYTGLRHNHIQWLDAEKFDSFADVSGDYTQLYVNTDKATKNAWLPHVNVRVIEILRDQLNWRMKVNEPLFKEKQFYNDNPETAYAKFLPLFASGTNGLPHSDTAYANVWSELIAGFQSILPKFIDSKEETIPILCKLRPPGVEFKDFNEREKLRKFQDKSLNKVDLTVVTEITPHSSRVGVVSDLIHYLPAECIGKYITGQKEATVYHYVSVDPDDQEAQQAYQAMDMRVRAVQQKISEFVNNDRRADETFIKADAVNSGLARSMRVDVRETIARYGFISIVSAEGESGLDLLQERGSEQASFNKTEICPFGNHCPSDLVKRLKGFRRCSICPFAVRSIDHLPAISARKKCAVEMLTTLDGKMRAALTNKTFSPSELDELDEERVRLGEDVAGWELCEEVLEQARRRIENGVDSRRWVVEKPEIILKHLQQVNMASEPTSYLLSRLMECNAYPGYQSPLISKKFELLRRKILAKAGKSLEDVLSMQTSDDPAAECAGVIRSLVEAHKLTVDDLTKILSSEAHLDALPTRQTLKIAHA